MDILALIERTLRTAGECVMQHFGSNAETRTKVDGSTVTAADTESERLIAQTIRTFFPDDKIMAEESGLSSTDRLPGSMIWVIDPLDGTANFASGLAHFCISVARAVFIPGGTARVLAGGVYDPYHRKMYLAERGYGSFLNGAPIKVRTGRTLEQALLGTSIYYGRGQGISQDITCYEHVAWSCPTVRRLGAAALDLALTAEGVFDGYFEYGLKPWDMAAGSLLVEEAGGRVMNYRDRTAFSFEHPSIIAGTPHIVSRLASIVAYHYPPQEEQECNIPKSTALNSSSPSHLVSERSKS